MVFILLTITLVACTGRSVKNNIAENYTACIGLTREETFAALGLTADDISEERSPYSLLVTSAETELGGMPFETWLYFDAESDVLYSVSYIAEAEGRNAAYFDAVKAHAGELTEACGEPVTADGYTFYLSRFDAYDDAPKDGAACRDTWNMPLEGELAARMPLTFLYKGETVEFSKLYVIMSAAFDERSGRETAECRIEYRIVRDGVGY